MKNKIICETTTNRYEFNRTYKQYLEKKGKIKCCYCKYHENENSTDKYYGNYGWRSDDGLRYPNWKLVSKNPKQWMTKPIKFIETISRWHNELNIEIKF